VLVGVYPTLPASAPLRRARPRYFPLDQGGASLTHLGRGAVWLALRAAGLGPGSRIAMPAYHCGSEVEAARLAGLEIDFYRVDSALRVDEEDLARATAACDATYLISHFGFPMAAVPGGGSGKLIEDAAHALFSCDGDAPIGSRGHCAIFCPRKSLGVPDGGALLVKGGPTAAPVGRPGRKAIARSTTSLLAGRAALSRARPLRGLAAGFIARTSRADRAARAGTLTETVIGEWDLEVSDMEAAASRPARLTEMLVRRVDPDAIRARRRRNYELLRDELAEFAPAPYRELPDGVAPLYFPALVADRPAAIAALLSHGVRAIEIWPVPHPLLDRERFSELEPARRRLIALPAHQDLDEWHMRVVLDAAKGVLRPAARRGLD